MKIEFANSPILKRISRELLECSRKSFDTAEIVWKYVLLKHEAFKGSSRFKEAVEVAKNNGIDAEIFNDIVDWEYSDLRLKVFQKLKLDGKKDVELKLRVLNDQDLLPL